MRSINSYVPGSPLPKGTASFPWTSKREWRSSRRTRSSIWWKNACRKCSWGGMHPIWRNSKIIDKAQNYFHETIVTGTIHPNSAHDGPTHKGGLEGRPPALDRKRGHPGVRGKDREGGRL